MIDRNKFISDLYRDYYKTIKSDARRRLRDDILAEDFVQEFFLHILTNLDDYDATRGTFKSWFYHQKLFFLRKRRFQHDNRYISPKAYLRGDGDANDTFDIIENSSYPEGDSKEYTELYLSKAAILNQQGKQVLTSYLVEGKTFHEIGTDMGVSRQRIEQIFKAAVKKIKESLEVK